MPPRIPEESLAAIEQAVAKHPDGGASLSDVAEALPERLAYRTLQYRLKYLVDKGRLITDGDITAAVAPSLPNSGVDLYVGMGGSPEGVLAAAALKCLGGDIQLRMWFDQERHADHYAEVAAEVPPGDLTKVFRVDDLVVGDSALFCATGITDSPLLPGVKLIGHRAETHSILMRARSGTVRHIQAVHQLDRKSTPLREAFLKDL